MLDRIKADLTAAMKRRDAVAVSTLRMLLADAKNVLVETTRKDALTPEEGIALVQRGAKRRREAIEEYEKAGRADLAEKEAAELHVLEAYLPKQLSPEETEALVDQAIAATAAATKRDMGKVMKEIMAKHKGEVDGKLVQQLASGKLA